jgi:hypothetical protein
MRFPLKYLLPLLFLFSPAAQAEFDPILYDQKEAERNWKEEGVKLPEAPRDENLLPFVLGAATSNAFFVDATSIKVGVDDVVRFTVVIRSPSGARNVSYEGLRCGKREAKVYAYGRNDGSWAYSRKPEWKEIPKSIPNRYQNVLFDDFFCVDWRIVKDQEEAIDALRAGNHPRAVRR